MGGGLLQLIGFLKNHSQLGPKSTRQYCISSKAPVTGQPGWPMTLTASVVVVVLLGGGGFVTRERFVTWGRSLRFVTGGGCVTSEDVTWRAKRLLMATLGGNLQPPLFVAQAPNHRPVCQPGN